ncbi:hypothetical protein [Micromonospora halophytica]|uniref:Uncharacterized protein n=1 Tax=Micromonospora halophytica TaxID=47864 RepID=A0A1C5I5H2_9ACTN|nr:hypothetical protein [Micromonospora halophytica]SCG53538.1 hypothetical protein GA0070560_10842 [Micromonospora halophytica]
MPDFLGWETLRQVPGDTDARRRRRAGALVLVGGLVLLVTASRSGSPSP